MPHLKGKVYVNARFDLIWQNLLEKIEHPSRYVDGIRNVEILEKDENHILRVIRWENSQWQELKELIVSDKDSGLIVFRLVDHPSFEGETLNICRTTNQVYQSELEYSIDWKLKHHGEESNQEQENAQKALELALTKMKQVCEEAETTDS